MNSNYVDKIVTEATEAINALTHQDEAVAAIPVIVREAIDRAIHEEKADDFQITTKPEMLSMMINELRWKMRDIVKIGGGCDNCERKDKIARHSYDAMTPEGLRFAENGEKTLSLLEGHE